jgi:hypothetical protein
MECLEWGSGRSLHIMPSADPVFQTLIAQKRLDKPMFAFKLADNSPGSVVRTEMTLTISNPEQTVSTRAKSTYYLHTNEATAMWDEENLEKSHTSDVPVITLRQSHSRKSATIRRTSDDRRNDSTLNQIRQVLPQCRAHRSLGDR